MTSLSLLADRTVHSSIYTMAMVLSYHPVVDSYIACQYDMTMFFCFLLFFVFLFVCFFFCFFLQCISVVGSTRRVNISEEHQRRLGEHFEIKPFY